jgi:hypothetical protein
MSEKIGIQIEVSDGDLKKLVREITVLESTAKNADNALKNMGKAISEAVKAKNAQEHGFNGRPRDEGHAGSGAAALGEGGGAGALGILKGAGAAAAIAATAILAVGVAGTTAAVGILRFVEAGSQAGDMAHELSIRTGASVEFITGAGFAAAQAGVGTEQFANALGILTERATSAPTEFSKWGISVRNAMGGVKDSESLLRDVADRMLKAKSASEKAAIGMDLFGRQGRNMVEFLGDGSAGLDAFIHRAEQLGIVISAASAALADEFNDKLHELEGTIGAVHRVLAEKFMPVLSMVFEAGSEAFSKFLEWVEKNDRALHKMAVSTIQLFLKAVQIAASVMSAMAGAAGVLASVITDRFEPAFAGASALLDQVARGAGDLNQKLDENATNTGKVIPKVENETLARAALTNQISAEAAARRHLIDANEGAASSLQDTLDNLEKLRNHETTTPNIEAAGAQITQARNQAEELLKMHQHLEDERMNITKRVTAQRDIYTEVAADKNADAINVRYLKYGFALKDATAKNYAMLLLKNANADASANARQTTEVETAMNAQKQAVSDAYALYDQYRQFNIQRAAMAADNEVAITKRKIDQQIADTERLYAIAKADDDRLTSAIQKMANDVSSGIMSTFDTLRNEMSTIGSIEVKTQQKIAVKNGEIVEKYLQHASKAEIEAYKKAGKSIEVVTETTEIKTKTAGKAIMNVMKSISEMAAKEAIAQVIRIGVVEAAERSSTVSAIAMNAAKSGSEAASSQAGIPIVGPILAVAAMATVFAAVMAMASKFEKGGFVGGPTGTDRTPAWLTRGEYVMSLGEVNAAKQGVPPPIVARSQGGQAPGNVTQNFMAFTNSRAQVRRLERDVFARERRTMTKRGMVTV